MLKIIKLQHQLKRHFSTAKDCLYAELLKERSLLHLSGRDARVFLQGLVTNDIYHLQGSSSSIYAMFLNSKGRVLYDSLIYNTGKENSYYVECDICGSPNLIKHLNMYKIQRKVFIDCLMEKFNIWTVVYNQSLIDPSVVCDYKNILELIQRNLPDILVSKDPRLPCLGLRIITPKNINLKVEFKKIDVELELKNFYKQHRYKLGVGEGMQELPYEKCFPMEANGDYLNGISFHKGCYIGQELTARTYHTGVTRKRLMPLFFQQEVKLNEPGTLIYSILSKKSIGKLYGVEETNGLGILKIDEALKADELNVLDTKCTTSKPFWWPLEASKESVTAG